MKNLFWLISILMIGIALGSCSNAELSEPEDVSLKNQDTYLLSENTALENAEKALSAFKKKKTRSACSLATINRFQTNQTHTRGNSESSNRGFYIINYGNNEGFAVVSADKRDANVYAFSDDGHLNLSDTLENSGLSWYLNYAMPEMSDFVIIPNDTLKPIELPWHYNETLSEPLLKGFMSQFHQSYPYNKYCNSGFPAYESRFVGCGPLAVGTIMGYFKWPQSADGTLFHWDQMSNDRYNDDWFKLFEILGRPSYLNSDYSNPEGTSTLSSNYVKAFKNMKYINQKLDNFTTSTISNELKSNKPVMCRGNHASTSQGHVWIIDGGYVIGNEEPPVVSGDTKKKVFTYYFNCIWGWGGTSNGYFQYYPTGTSLSSYKGLQIIYGFTPEK